MSGKQILRFKKNTFTFFVNVFFYYTRVRQIFRGFKYIMTLPFGGEGCM